MGPFSITRCSSAPDSAFTITDYSSEYVTKVPTPAAAELWIDRYYQAQAQGDRFLRTNIHHRLMEIREARSRRIAAAKQAAAARPQKQLTLSCGAKVFVTAAP